MKRFLKRRWKILTALGIFWWLFYSAFGGQMATLLYFMVMISMSIGQFVLIFYFLSCIGTFEVVLPDEINVSWSDVYGQDKTVKRLTEVQYFLENPEEIEKHGGYVPKGILMTGPPGVGKTYMAKAMASSTKHPILIAGPGSFTNMFMGVNILKVKRLFREARKQAEWYGGCIVFMDEIDSLGSRGGQVLDDNNSNSTWRAVMGGFGGGNMGTLEVFLSEMDGLQKNRGIYHRLRRTVGLHSLPVPPRRILFLGATNMPQRLDPALVRPGRFDRKIAVPYPDREGRRSTFVGYLAKVANTITEAQLDILAANNPRASGAVIKDAVNEALIKAVRDGRDRINWEDLRDAIIWKQMGEDEGKQTYEEDQWRVALHEAGHAVAAHHFRKSEKIQFASVVRRGSTLGVVSSVSEDERFTTPKSELIADIKVALASVWAERRFFDGDLSTGPTSDLENANRTADLILTKWAMGDSLAVVLENEEEILGEYLYDKRTELLEEIYGEMAAFLDSRADQVEFIAKFLNEKETIDGVELHRILNAMELERRPARSEMERLMDDALGQEPLLNVFKKGKNE